MIFKNQNEENNTLTLYFKIAIVLSSVYIFFDTKVENYNIFKSFGLISLKLLTSPDFRV